MDTGTIYRVHGTQVNAAVSGMNVDADGSPECYHPDGSPPGLDYLANAGSPGHWWGIATSNGQPSGTPIVQHHEDPAPGFYVSTTALMDPQYSFKNPLAYANAQTIPFIVIPGSSSSLGWKTGDFATACILKESKCHHGIVADIGPRHKFGEASMKMASSIGLNDSPKHGWASSGVAYIVYTGTRGMRPQAIPTDDQIQKIGDGLYEKYDGDGILAALKDKARLEQLQKLVE